ncbi:hypothetical protein B0H13DRAFT_1868011 [Mycena leptocephala]|nr:hypothetical protein B0H13DRAFT_1868011 [Mycena leptocephala]
MSPPKPTHPLAHLPDPPQNHMPCAPTKYWPSTMDEEQHSSQGNKWWWLVYLGPMQGAYATRWKKSCFHWHGHCPVHFVCASVCHHPKPTTAVRTNEATASTRNSVRAAQHSATVPNDSAGSISSIPHAWHIVPSTPQDSASSISHSPCAGPAAHLSGGWGQGGGLSGGSSRTDLSVHVHPPQPQPQCSFVSMSSRLSSPLPLLLLIPHPPGPSPLWLQLDKGLTLTWPPVGSSQ